MGWGERLFEFDWEEEGGGRLFEAGRLLTFSAFRMGAYSRWALIRGWALIRINTVDLNTVEPLQYGHRRDRVKCPY